MDAKTIKIPAFTYDGQGGEVYFFAGEGPQPSSKGFIVPDELGYLDPIGIYRNQDVILQLPGAKTIFEIAERLPVGDLGHSILLGGGMQLCTVDPSQKFIVTGTSSLTKNLMTN